MGQLNPDPNHRQGLNLDPQPFILIDIYLIFCSAASVRIYLSVSFPPVVKVPTDTLYSGTNSGSTVYLINDYSTMLLI